MANRYRWLSIDTSHRGDSLAKLLLARHGRAKREYWFSEAEMADGSEGIRFYWKTLLQVTREDDNGSAVTEAVLSLSSVDFAIVNVGRQILLRLLNPSRNMRVLLAALEETIGAGFSCAPVLFERNAPVSILERVDDVKLVGLKVTNVVVGRDLVARMEFASKQGIPESELKILKGLSYRREQVTYELVYRGVRGQFAYSSNGSVKLAGALSPRILTYIEKDFLRLLRR